MIKFDFQSFKGNVYKGIEHDSRLKDVDWSEFFKKNFVLITHNGQFHADDVFCVALVYILYVISNHDTAPLDMNSFIDKHLIREPSLDVVIEKHGWILSEDVNVIVFDIVGGHYDHHCAKTQIPNMTKMDLDESNINLDYLLKYCSCDMDLTGFASAFDLCSFGQLWQHIGRGFNHKFVNLPERSEDYKELYDNLIDMSVFSRVFKEYALPISLVDLNGPKNWNSPINRIIANCNRDTEIFVGGFRGAFNMAVTMLVGEINNVQSQCETLDDVYGKLIHSETKSGAYVSEFLHGEQSYIVIPDGYDMNINLNTLEYIYVRNSNGKITNPLFIFNQNPSARDGAYRIVCGSKIVLDKKYIDAVGIKYKFCHEAGFMITFETIEDAQNFIGWLDSTSTHIAEWINQYA